MFENKFEIGKQYKFQQFAKNYYLHMCSYKYAIDINEKIKNIVSKIDSLKFTVLNINQSNGISEIELENGEILKSIDFNMAFFIHSDEFIYFIEVQ